VSCLLSTLSPVNTCSLLATCVDVATESHHRPKGRLIKFGHGALSRSIQLARVHVDGLVLTGCWCADRMFPLFVFAAGVVYISSHDLCGYRNWGDNEGTCRQTKWCRRTGASLGGHTRPICPLYVPTAVSSCQTTCLQFKLAKSRWSRCTHVSS
jgi:hypothetical protein